MFSSRRLSSSLNFSFLPGSRSNNASPNTAESAPQRNRSATITTMPSPRVDENVPVESPESPVEADQQDLSITLIARPSLNTAHPSFSFPRISRTLSSTKAILRIGRYSDQRALREEHAALNADGKPGEPVFDPPIGFKSKVVSRRHCEIWHEGSDWFIKDVKSSSGTFVNNFRLSGPKTESRPHRIRNGDIIQLGIDFRGGQEEVFRCVKMTVIFGKNGQPRVTNYNRSILKSLTASGSGSSTDVCAICLCKISPCQALFMAPCSHVWHYKCILRLLNGPAAPSFLCPNCRSVSALDADIEDGPDEENEDETDPTTPGPSTFSSPSASHQRTGSNQDILDVSSTQSSPTTALPSANRTQEPGQAESIFSVIESVVPEARNGSPTTQLHVQLENMSVASSPSRASNFATPLASPPANSDTQQTNSVNENRPSPKMFSVTPPGVSFLDSHTATAAILAASGGNYADADQSLITPSDESAPQNIGSSSGQSK